MSAALPFIRFQTYSATRDHNFAHNANFDEIEAKHYDGLSIPGGWAPEYLVHSPLAVALEIESAKSERAIASICLGQLILAAADVVKGRWCTAFPPAKPTQVGSSAHWIEPETMSATVVDGNLFTAATYEGHPEFICHFVKAIGSSITDSIKMTMLL